MKKKERRTTAMEWLHDREAHRRVDSHLIEWVSEIKAKIDNLAEKEAAESGADVSLVRVAIASAWLDASRDLLAWEAALARNSGASYALISESAGRAPTSNPRTDWRPFDALVAADREAWEHRGEEGWAPEPVNGYRLSIKVATYEPDGKSAIPKPKVEEPET